MLPIFVYNKRESLTMAIVTVSNFTERNAMPAELAPMNIHVSGGLRESILTAKPLFVSVEEILCPEK